MKMKYECDMIADLLPLYKDGACSEASEKIIKEHLSECEKCSNLLDRMGESEIDEQMIREKDDVISSQAKFFKRKSALAGGIVAAVFAIPILVCLIVNLATGAGLTWFFIVLAAMCIPASLIVVPLMAPEHKFLLSAGAFSASLIMLLGVVSIYTGGSWFFIAASSVLFGLVVLIGPFVIATEPVKSALKDFKGLTLMGAYTVTFLLMMICIGLTVGGGFFRMAFAIAGPLVGMAWVIFLLIRYLHANGFIKAGICIAALSVFSFFSTDIVWMLMDTSIDNNSMVMVSVVSPLIWLYVGVGIGLVFLIIGIIIKAVGGKKDEN